MRHLRSARYAMSCSFAILSVSFAMASGCSGGSDDQTPGEESSVQGDEAAAAGKSDWVGNKAEGDECFLNIECDSPLVCRRDPDFRQKRSLCLPLGKYAESCDETADCGEGLKCPSIVDRVVGALVSGGDQFCQ